MDTTYSIQSGVGAPGATAAIRIADYDYPLPDSRIALHPLPRRDACLLMVSDRQGTISDSTFGNLPDLLPEDALMVCNETRVINARMEFRKATGARIEVFLLEPSAPSDYVLSFASRKSCVWCCMIGNLKKWKEEVLIKEIVTKEGVRITLRAVLLPQAPGEAPSAARKVEFSWTGSDVSFATVVETAGHIPIPPYLKRDSEESDTEDYQTVYSRVDGSVAAPTAGLHFTPELFGSLRERRHIDIRKVTLHVGAGTFQPVKSREIGGHPMHTESIHVDIDVIRALADALEAGREVVAVGTTSVRTLESLPWLAVLSRTADVADASAMHVGQWMAYDPRYAGEDGSTLLRELIERMEGAGLDSLSASTAIMIAPGFKWRVVGTMVTNFHQPQSTLLLLVGSFLEGFDSPGRPHWREVYNHALAGAYRFLSYGDACLFSRRMERKA